MKKTAKRAKSKADAPAKPVKEENAPEKSEKRSVSDEAAKNSVVADGLMVRKPGETISAWKHRVGLSNVKPKSPKKIK